MNAERLLAHYERIADAPDAITRLRRFILDLAVRGKLVPQDPKDESASELLKRIAAEKSRLDRKERTRRKPMNVDGTARAKALLPEGWVLAPLCDLVTVLNGRAYKQNELLNAGTPVLRVGNLFTSDKWYYSDLCLDDDKYCDKGDLIFAWSASFGPFIWNGERVIYHYHIWKLPLHSEADLDKLYLYNFLLHKTREIKEAGHGISMIHMTKEKMEQIEVSLPPLAEQHRIVAKVDELMALCDRLEAARAERKATRDRLTAASLARLNVSDPETFQANARFALDNLAVLTTRPDQIEQLRQTILNLAVRGHLVPQDPRNEHIAETYAREPSSDELPNNWRLLSFGKFCDIEGGNQPPKSQFISEPRKGYVRLLQIRDLGERPVPTFIPIGSTNRFCKEGEILIGRYGASVGKIFWAQDGAYNVAMAKFIWPDDALISSFAFLLLKSEYLQGPLASATRSAQAGFNKGDLAAINFPLPPLAEQHRIVARVDELMALCDRLEASLTTTDDTRRRLLEALLAEALAPDEERELEAAE